MRTMAENPKGVTDLHKAAIVGRVGTVQQLLEAGAAVDARVIDAQDWTPLHVAALLGHTAVVQVLLDAGAAVGAADSFGFTALHLAAGVNAAALQPLEYLKAVGVLPDADAANDLDQAAFAGHAAIVQLLLKAKASVNAAAMGRRTALHLAAREGHAELVQLLLAAKAPMEATAADDYTALKFAAKNGHIAVVRLLLMHRHL
jgi:ankyrin repeat protein